MFLRLTCLSLTLSQLSGLLLSEEFRGSRGGFCAGERFPGPRPERSVELALPWRDLCMAWGQLLLCSTSRVPMEAAQSSDCVVG